MREFKVKVEIRLKSVVLDPQGKAALSALRSIGFEEVEDARIGKLIEIKLAAESRDEARERAGEMCRRILANPIIEDFAVEIIEN
ncbi:MAG: phosphoribosylformylglycinamidine synthase subunit PurS [Deltaproteobacteria bacterium]